MKQISISEWTALSTEEKSARAAALFASVEWKDDHLYVIGNPIDNPEGIGGYPMYLCSLDEDGNPYLGMVQSVVSPDPEDWEPAQRVITSISEIFPQF